MSNQTKQRIQQALQPFAQGDLRAHSLRLLQTLGYQSERQLALDPAPAAFLSAFDTGNFRPDRALFDHWTAVHLLCQITDADIRQANPLILLDSAGKTIDNAIIESYLFMAIDLRSAGYTRTQLAHITREVNKLFGMPALILFRHGDTLTLSIINRRLHKREQSKDVLEKVTLIKDVRCADPHPAHLEILDDLSLDKLYSVHQFANFVELHKAWQTTLDSSELNKKFFREIADWYFWAVNEVTFPADAGPAETRNATSLIRLLTRLIFVWFLKEKGVIPDELFNRRALDRLLTGEDLQESIFYKAILQNLFFATLNQEMNTPQKPDSRKFRRARESGQSQHYLIPNVYRYERYFSDPQAALALFADIPFLNGGLFECLDGEVDDRALRIDGFSDRADNPLRVPDDLFFGAERYIDLNETYGTSGKRYQVRGLIETLSRYKFTIAENTPIEEEIALDPELLGKVFENLLAAYNPETGTTARKQTGSFYTPREIVNYMVDESLLAYLQTKLQDAPNLTGLGDLSGLESRLRHLFAYNEEPHQFSPAEVAALITAIDQVNILDPACGSGAFPMGILHKLVFILSKLDPHNAQWKERQIAPLRQAIAAAMAIPDSRIRNQTVQELEDQIAAIEAAFARNELDYGRKLYLIENCIYGVDIQPVAVQIAKLRFFISLVVDQRLDAAAPNRGILPLPNLETKFVAANTLLGLEKPPQMALRNQAITAKEKELAEVRSKHFRARTPRTKAKWRTEDKRLRDEISALLEKEGMLRNEDVRRLAGWDPYNQNASADFFDPEWMFGLESGFDVVIGNPPYVSALNLSTIYEESTKEKLKTSYSTARGAFDIYILFIECGIRLLSSRGTLFYITPNKYLSAKYASALRKFILQEASLVHIVDLSSIKVFEEASVYPIISQINNYQSTKKVRSLLPKNEGMERFSKEEFYSVEIEPDLLTMLPENLWGFLLSNRVALLSKIIAGTQPLENFGQVNATTTAAEADQYGQCLTNVHQADSMKVVNTGTIDRYESLWGKREMTHGGKKYLTPFLPLKIASVNKRRSEMYRSPKVIFAKMAKECEALVDLKGEYASLNTNCFFAPHSNIAIQYIAAFCNSRLFTFIYEQLFGALRMSGGYFQFQAPQIRVMPLKFISQEQQIPFINLVDKLVATKEIDPTADVSALEQEIDQLVYALYGLTPAEIALVEGREEAHSDRFSGTEAAEAATTNAEVSSNRFGTSAPPLLFTGQPLQGSFSEKRARLEKLTKEASPSAIQDLVAALADDNATIRWQAAAALRTIGGPQVVGVLQAFIAHATDLSGLPAAKTEAEKLLATLT